MKKNMLPIQFIVLVGVLSVCGCAGMQGLPQGSVLTGDYEGSFNGKFFWGSIEVKVYDAPGGSRPVFGRLNQLAEEGFLDFRGEMKGSRLEAQFTIANGTVSGELSADGKSLTGTYRLTDPPFDQGTWNAQKR